MLFLYKTPLFEDPETGERSPGVIAENFEVEKAHIGPGYRLVSIDSTSIVFSLPRRLPTDLPDGWEDLSE